MSDVYVTRELVAKLLKTRIADSHKGMFGHLLLVCGCYNMPGAAILATGGALRSGCGLVTVHTCENIRIAIMTKYPSAMLSTDKGCFFSTVPERMERYSVVGVGCGLGQEECSVKAFSELLVYCKEHDIPMIIDADGLNILAANNKLLKLVPEKTVLTPHLGELRRLIGNWKDRAEMLERTMELVMTLKSVVIIKGYESNILTTNGIYINTTGNAGMAKGGSGDVLTGLISGLRARGYSAKDAAIIGVWLHGYAGDKASEYLGQEAMNSADIIDFLHEGFKVLE